MKKLHAKIVKNGPLTDKECVVLQYLCEGYFRPEIAVKLNRSLSTVSTHIEHIADKLQARGSTEIVLLAEKLGLIEIKIINQSHHYLLNGALILLIALQLTTPQHGRRPPRTPRPSIRLVRQRIA